MNELKIGAVAVGVAVALAYGVGGFTGIEPGETGLLVKQFGEDKGMQKRTLGTGTHWVDPIMYDTPVYDTRFRQYSLTGDNAVGAQTKDGQPIMVDISLEMGLTDELVPTIHEEIGKEFWLKVIYPALRAAIRSEVPSQMSDTIYTATGRSLVQERLQHLMDEKFRNRGFNITVNLRDIEFTNPEFVHKLEEKASAAQQVLIAERQAEAAVHTAKKVENQAEGAKQKVIKEAEAEAQKLKLEGIGERDKKMEEAKGILAIAKAKAEGQRLSVQAFGDGDTYASVRWAEEMGANVKVYGFPTGAPGTASVMDLNGVFKGVFPK